MARKGAHVGVSNALKDAQKQANEVGGEDLAAEHGAWFGVAA